MSPTLNLTLDLIRCPSVTPVDANCQELMIQRLEKIGFTVERLRFGEVDNFWARRGNRAKSHAQYFVPLNRSKRNLAGVLCFQTTVST